MTIDGQCSQWDGKSQRCMSGHIRTSSLCWGVESGATPQCLVDEPPAHLIDESGVPLAVHVTEK